MDTVRIVGLYSSEPRSGKSTVAKFLQRLGFERRKFAEPLRSLFTNLAISAGLTFEEAEWLLEEGKTLAQPAIGISYRDFAREVGTNVLRAADRNLFVRIMEDALTDYPRTPVVIDDVRFPNEFAMIHRRGGELWCIHRDVARSRDPLEGQLDGCGFDHVIFNDADTFALHRKVMDILAG